MAENKNLEDFFSHDYYIQCRGRGANGKELSEGELLKVKVHIYKSPGSNLISSDVSDCEYNCGSHGQNCSASTDGIPSGAICCYSFDVPGDFNSK